MKEAAKTMRGTKIYAEKEECKSRIENEKIYLTECNKFNRRSYRSLLNQYDEQKTWDIIRRYAPK